MRKSACVRGEGVSRGWIGYSVCVCDHMILLNDHLTRLNHFRLRPTLWDCAGYWDTTTR